MSSRSLGALAFTLLLPACASNPWPSSYVDRLPSVRPPLQHRVSPPTVLMGRTPATDEASLREQGFLLLGVAHVVGTRPIRAQILEQARRVDAFVLVVYRNAESADLSLIGTTTGDGVYRAGTPWTVLPPCLDPEVPSTDAQTTACLSLHPPAFQSADGSESAVEQSAFSSTTVTFWGRPDA